MLPLKTNPLYHRARPDISIRGDASNCCCGFYGRAFGAGSAQLTVPAKPNWTQFLKLTKSNRREGWVGQGGSKLSGCGRDENWRPKSLGWSPVSCSPKQPNQCFSLFTHTRFSQTIPHITVLVSDSRIGGPGWPSPGNNNGFLAPVTRARLSLRAAAGGD